LQLITRPLIERESGSELQKVPRHSAVNRPANKALWGFIMMFIGIAIGIIGKKLMHEEIVTVVGALLAIAGMFLLAYPFLSPAASATYLPGAPSPPKGLGESSPAKYLVQGNETGYIPAVTERTTDLLENPIASRPRPANDKE